MKTGESEKLWDVAVIGGGPAGMMAAGRAAESGASVILIEKNPSLGKKLLITGGGRCNVTNAEFDVKRLLARYKNAGKFLASPFSQWDAKRSVEFFEARGMPTKVEADQRVFPVSNSARSVYDTLIAYMQEHKVTVMTDSPVVSLTEENGTLVSAQLSGKRTIRAKTFILAAGGISRPETGSNGDGFKILKRLGHTVDESGGALVPVALKKSPTARAAGVALAEAKLTLFQDGVKQNSQIGKILFTHIGLSGPATLNISRELGQLLLHGPVEIQIDMFPKDGYEKMNAMLQELFKTNTNKHIKNSFGAALAPALVPVVLEKADIDPDKMCNSVTRDERMSLIKTLKHFTVEADHLLGLEKAVVTSGGLALTEVDFKTMRSLKYENLYVVGDILDIDRPSGGYSLQLCWTSGFVAGTSAAALAMQQ